MTVKSDESVGRPCPQRSKPEMTMPGGGNRSAYFHRFRCGGCLSLFSIRLLAVGKNIAYTERDCRRDWW